MALITRSMRMWSATAAALVLLGCAKTPPVPEPEGRPNLLVVLADDLGFSDTGPYGGEIRTPTLDALAAAGFVATNFYVAPRGGPTRAMLMTGVDHHLAGFGGVRGQREGTRGNEGRLTPNVVSVATVLRGAGYRTYMAGKWQLGELPAARPAAHGFDETFAVLDATASHWADRATLAPGRDQALYSRNGELLERLPDDHFSTRAYVDFLIERLSEDREDERPFFAYLAFQAPHSPLAVPEDWRDRYAGRYDVGFQRIQQRRLTALKHRRMVRKDVVPFPGLPTVPQWGDLDEDQRARQTRRMELYAAMVENLDFHLGRLLESLEAMDARRDTLVVFLSDNGASPSNRGVDGPQPQLRERIELRFPLSGSDHWGHPGSFVEYGAGWAQTSSVPFRMFKGSHAEGGIRSPLIVSGPGVVARSLASRELLHVTDLVPTLLDAAGASYPTEHAGVAVEPMAGRSLRSILAGSERPLRSDQEWIAFELQGDRAIRRGIWKAVWMKAPLGIGQWRLYRLDRDPSELFDRSSSRKTTLDQLVRLWEGFAEAKQVYIEPDAVAAPPP